jgi:hypothetical protein
MKIKSADHGRNVVSLKFCLNLNVGAKKLQEDIHLLIRNKIDPGIYYSNYRPSIIRHNSNTFTD